MSAPAPPSPLAIAALVLGVVSALMVIVGLIWASAAEGEAILVPMVIVLIQLILLFAWANSQTFEY